MLELSIWFVHRHMHINRLLDSNESCKYLATGQASRGMILWNFGKILLNYKF